MDSVIRALKEQIDKKLASLIERQSPYYQSLYDGAKYALLAPGKRIRPLLTLCAAEILQPGSAEIALTPACAIEMIHTYSLIHDDLPCMDDDDMRRGQPTLHKVYTEGHAVLMGDYLLTFAFETLANAPWLHAEQKLALIQTLAACAGGDGMIGGQVMDIENALAVELMHELKTAALFRASLAFGAIVASASPTSLDSFALHFGKLFQVVDDLLDDDHPLGRDHAQQSAQDLYQTTLATLTHLPGDSSLLQTLTHSLFESRVREFIRV